MIPIALPFLFLCISILSSIPLGIIFSPPFLFLCICAYILGSIPFGLILTKLAGLGDIRNIGSGNIGATNVLRTGNKPLAFFTLLLDGGKGALAVCIGYLLVPDQQTPMLMGIYAVIGHIFPVFLKFKGGKGVATVIGFYLMLSWQVGLAVIATWLLTAFISRKSSLAAIVAIALAPFFITFILHRTGYLGPICILSLLIIYRHKDNIQRLLNGTEPSIGKKS